MTEVLVAGGGVGGCAAALALQRAGVTVAVNEAHPTSTEDLGAFMVLGSGAVDVLAQLGALGGVDREAERVERFNMETPDGSRTIRSTPLATGGAAIPRLVRRGHLCQALQEAVLDAGIDLRRGARLMGTQGQFGAVDSVDESGERRAVDLVVGADGLWSTLRRQLNDDGAEPRYVGQRVFWGLCPTTAYGELNAMQASRTDDLAFGYYPTPAGTFWFARTTDDELTRDQLGDSDPARLLRARLVGAPRELVESSSEVMVTNAYDLPWVRNWSGDGALLIGDAAHAASPATGRGGSLALMDGFVLGKAVRDHPTDLGAAVSAFEQSCRHRAQANIVASARLSVGDAALKDAPQGRALEPEEEAAQLRWDLPLPA